MNKRHIAAGIVGALGFLLMLSAVSLADFGELPIGDFAARSIVGILLMAASLPISGDLAADDYAPKRKKKRGE